MCTLLTVKANYSAQADRVEGYEVVTLGSHEADLQASFAPGAGMVGCSLRHAGEELLHLGGGLGEYARTGAPMGIPFLHPWANRLASFEYSFEGNTVVLDPDSPLLLRDGNGLPIHGLLGGSPHWRVLDASADGDGARLSAELDFGAHEDLIAAFPFPHLVRLDVELEAATLTVRTTVTPTGEGRVPISFGFHPYLRLPSVPRERWEVELPVGRRLALDERMIPTGGGDPVRFGRAPLGGRVFDDGFDELDAGRPFTIAAAGRELQTTFTSGYPFAQVYSPADAQFICFEPMTAPTNALAAGGKLLPVVRAPGRYSAGFRISIEVGR